LIKQKTTRWNRAAAGGKDFDMAFKKAGLSDKDIKKIKESGDWVWHHLDDYNPITNECTMQLVLDKIHTKSKSHLGGATMYKKHMKIGYPNRK
tara:strand:- start:41850 stop:42128 length:279 start_codon:yes stop_codon:yes gene_type:complete